MHLRPALRRLALLPLVIAASGCLSLGPKVPDQLITFTPRQIAAAGSTGAGEVTGATIVLEPEVEDRLDVNRVPVRIDATSVAYLQDATYVDRPARLFQHLLAERIRVAKGGLVLEGEDPGVLVSTRIYGRLVEAGYDAQAQSVSVIYDAVTVAPDGQMRQRRFSATVPSVTAEAAAVAPALNDAANDVVEQVAAWL